MHLIDLVLEAGHHGQLKGQVAEGIIDPKAEEDNPTEVQTVTEAPATAEAPYKTATTEDHRDVAGAVQHPTVIKSVTLPHL